MMEKYRDADAIVTIEGKEYALYKKGPLKKYPYMIDIATGGIPHREQPAPWCHYTEAAQESDPPFEQRQFHNVYICDRRFGRILSDHGEHTRIPDTSMYLYRKRKLPDFQGFNSRGVGVVEK